LLDRFLLKKENLRRRVPGEGLKKETLEISVSIFFVYSKATTLRSEKQDADDARQHPVSEEDQERGIFSKL